MSAKHGYCDICLRPIWSHEAKRPCRGGRVLNDDAALSTKELARSAPLGDWPWIVCGLDYLGLVVCQGMPWTDSEGTYKYRRITKRVNGVLAPHPIYEDVPMADAVFVSDSPPKWKTPPSAETVRLCERIWSSHELDEHGIGVRV